MKNPKTTTTLFCLFALLAAFSPNPALADGSAGTTGSNTASAALQKGKDAEKQGDFTGAEKWYEVAAAQGDARAQYLLSRAIYRDAEIQAGFDPDDVLNELDDMDTDLMAKSGALIQESNHWLIQSANQGYIPAEMDMGANYSYGYCGFEKNQVLSLSWYKKAALQGDRGAQGQLGYMADNGFGMAPNPEEAVYWYKKAAAQGDKYSIRRLKELGISFP